MGSNLMDLSLFTTANYLFSALTFAFLLAKLLVRLKPAPLSPVYAILLVYLAMFLIGPFAYDPDYGGTGMSFDVSLADELSVIPEVLWILCAFIAGVLLFYFVSPKRSALRMDLKRFRAINVG